LNLIGVDQSKLTFVRGTDFQLKPQYTLDMYKLTTSLTTVHCERAGDEVVKKIDNPLMSSLLYPILQSLDEEYLGVNCQFGGVDQRKIFMFARTWLPKLNYKPRVYLMNPIVPGLGKPGEDGKPPKMSSSDPNSKIDFDDSNKTIKSKFGSAFSIDGVVENNGLLGILKYIIFRFLEQQNRPFIIKRLEKWGGDIVYNTYQEVEDSFAKGELASADLKTAMAREITDIITPLRDLINGEGKELFLTAYPPQQKVVNRQTVGEATFNCLDVRVGVMLKVERPEGLNRVYLEHIDVGESEPRIIASGLVEFFTAEELTGKKVLVICNLPPKKFGKTVTSYGMVLVASETVGEKRVLELISPPEDSKPGDHVFCEGLEGEIESEISKKRYTKISESLKTDSEGFPCSKGVRFQTQSGFCLVTKIKDGLIS